jgi:hypothetical protein
MRWIVYPWRVLVNLFYIAVVGYVFSRLHQRDEKIYVAILGLIYVAIRTQGVLTGMYLVPMIIHLSRQIDGLREFVDASFSRPPDEADQVERATNKLYARSLIESLGLAAIAGYCLLELFGALNTSEF